RARRRRRRVLPARSREHRDDRAPRTRDRPGRGEPRGGMNAERQLFAVLYRAAPGLAVSWWTLVVLRGLLPPAFAITMGVLVGAVQSGASLAAPLATAGVLFLLLQTAGPFHDALSSNLGERTTAWLHERLLDACVTPQGLAHFENPELADRLAAAR